MPSLLENLCLPAIKAKITLPKEPVKITEDKILFTYYTEGKMRFFEVQRGEEAGELMLENGFIDSYEGTGKFFTMFQKSMITVTGKGGQPVQMVKHTKLDWFKIKFFESDIIHIAARHQYELTSKLMGLIPPKKKAKCRSLYQANYKAA